MLDVDFGDMIDYLGGESDVSSIVMYANTAEVAAALVDLIREKPIPIVTS
jgi:hypothetical protein